MHPEGYGILELSHLLMPLAGMFIAIATMMRPWVQARRAIFAWLGLLALGCLYIAGEEHSWGQHFLHWNTPAYWSEINRQNETNLHNVSDIFDKAPRFALEVAILIGGIIYPIASLFWPKLRQSSFDLIFPPAVLLPTALILLLSKVLAILHKADILPRLAVRMSEVQETLIYLFILFAIILLRRRIIELENRKPAAGPQRSM